MRHITIPAIERRVSIAVYVKAVRLARENPTAEFKHGLTTWWPTTGRDISKQFLSGVHQRINESISYARRGAS